MPFAKVDSTSSVVDDRKAKDWVQDALQGVRRAVEAPSVGVELSSRWPRLGDTLAVQVKVPPPRTPVGWIRREFAKRFSGGELHVTLDGVECQCFPKQGSQSSGAKAGRGKIWRALVPFTPLDAPGKRELVVTLKDGRKKVHRETIGVVDVEFPTESIWLPKQKSNLHMTDLEREKTDAFREVRSEDQLWDKPFVRPCEGPVTTEFGMKRYYNGVFAQGYYHRGVDYGAPEGTPVYAPANGLVSLAGKEEEGFMIHGNCIGLDHGHGVASIFMHLSDLAVQEGEYVRRGQLVGRVGDTGISTGPHLHWGLYVNGACISPTSWLRGTIT